MSKSSHDLPVEHSVEYLRLRFLQERSPPIPVVLSDIRVPRQILNINSTVVLGLEVGHHPILDHVPPHQHREHRNLSHVGYVIVPTQVLSSLVHLLEAVKELSVQQLLEVVPHTLEKFVSTM